MISAPTRLRTRKIVVAAFRENHFEEGYVRGARSLKR